VEDTELLTQVEVALVPLLVVLVEVLHSRAQQTGELEQRIKVSEGEQTMVVAVELLRQELQDSVPVEHKLVKVEMALVLR
jgi:hypothetical protein